MIRRVSSGSAGAQDLETLDTGKAPIEGDGHPAPELEVSATDETVGEVRSRPLIFAQREPHENWTGSSLVM